MLSQLSPRMENSTGNPRCAVKPDSDMSWTIARCIPGIWESGAAKLGLNLRLAEGAVVLLFQRQEHHARGDVGAAEAADRGEVVVDILAPHRDLLGLGDHAAREVEATNPDRSASGPSRRL